MTWGFFTSATQPVQNHAVLKQFKAVGFSYGALLLFDAVVQKLHHLAAFDTQQVVMVLAIF